MTRAARIGCSGWSYDHWRGRLYPRAEPKRRWLELYAERFDTVEVNTTFYRLPRREAVAAWVEQTPKGFLFAVKASRYLTHIRRLGDIGEGTARFYDRIEPLVQAGRLGPVLWQLPENFHRDDARLHAWLGQLPPGRHTIEFRHPSWFVAPVLAALAARDVALTVGDHPERPVELRRATTEWRFVRLHYGRRGGGGDYAPAELSTWARRIAQWQRRGDVYAYFNNDWEGFAVNDALALRRRLGRGATG